MSIVNQRLLLNLSISILSFFFFFNDTATTEIYTLSLHDALPICFYLLGKVLKPNSSEIKTISTSGIIPTGVPAVYGAELSISYDDVSPNNPRLADATISKLRDRKSTRLNSSHTDISRMPSSA